MASWESVQQVRNSISAGFSLHVCADSLGFGEGNAGTWDIQILRATRDAHVLKNNSPYTLHTNTGTDESIEENIFIHSYMETIWL